MGEMGEFWRDVSDARQEKRADNREKSVTILKEKGIRFESRNNGAHLIIKYYNTIVDFWPGTGKYIFRTEAKRGRGVFNLLRHLEV